MVEKPSYFVHFLLFSAVWVKHGLKYNPKMARFGICPGKIFAGGASSIVYGCWMMQDTGSPLRGFHIPCEIIFAKPRQTRLSHVLSLSAAGGADG